MIKKFQFGKNLPTAPDAKEVYEGGTYKPRKYYSTVTVPFKSDMILRRIEQRINPITNDTTYVEYPSHIQEVRVKKRKAKSSDKNREEYNIMDRRFNESVSVSKKQQGGQMQQQDVLQQIIQLVQAAMQGDQKATQTIQQVMQAAEQGDPQAVQLAQMIQQVIEQMKG